MGNFTCDLYRHEGADTQRPGIRKHLRSEVERDGNEWRPRVVVEQPRWNQPRLSRRVQHEPSSSLANARFHQWPGPKSDHADQGFVSLRDTPVLSRAYWSLTVAGNHRLRGLFAFRI